MSNETKSRDKGINNNSMNGLEMHEIKSEVNSDIEISNLSAINNHIKSDSVVVYLDYKVLIGKYSKGSFTFPDNETIELRYILRMRIFNKNEELLIWRSNGKWKGRHRKDDIDGSGNWVVDNDQVLFGTTAKVSNGITKLTETRGTEIILPFEKSGVDEKQNRVKIKTRNYIDFNEIHQATYIDSRFVEFTFGEKNDPIGGVQ